MPPPHLLTQLLPQSCDGSTPCNDVTAFGWLDALVVAAVVLAIFVGPFVAIRALVRVRRRTAEEWSVPDNDGSDDESLHIPPWQGWFMSALLYLFFAVMLVVGLLLLAHFDEGIRVVAVMAVALDVLALIVLVLLDLRRWRAHRLALRRLAEKLTPRRNGAGST